jgi:7-cyano-7-deazaguanine reductase
MKAPHAVALPSLTTLNPTAMTAAKLKSTVKATAKSMTKTIGKAAPAQRPMPPNPPTAPSKQLHVFPNPAPQRDYVIQFQIPEFTCLCPLTGQPDFAHFVIDMVADELCVELKSLKMYMWSFRDEGAFHEKVTNDILSHIVGVTRPRFARITARWYVRGGIYTNVIAEHRKKGWKPQPVVALPDLGRETGLQG